MTQFTKNRKSTDSTVQAVVEILRNHDDLSLFDAVAGAHKRREASFHMPGHKNRVDFLAEDGSVSSAYSLDTTELAGLDDLTFPTGPIQKMESRFSEAYGVSQSCLTLGGASHGLLAAILAVSIPGHYMLVPRSAHRSILNAVVLSGVDIVWYDPVWDEDWKFWTSASVSNIESKLSQQSNCCGVIVVSPTFAGALSDIGAVSEICRKFKAPLIVDEAHGAHFLPGTNLPVSASLLGADVVVHSLHKTLTGLTQLGLVHLPKESLVDSHTLRSALRLVTSSSPSYPLMISAEQVSKLIGAKPFLEHLDEVTRLCDLTREKIKKSIGLKIFSTACGVDPFHISLRMKGFTGVELLDYFDTKGVFAESNLGNGCLLLAGSGSTKADFEELQKVVFELGSGLEMTSSEEIEPIRLEQVVNPKEAYFSEYELVSPENAIGRISAECIAPCPPGVPVASPGAIVPKEIKMFDSMLGKVRVIKE